MKRKMELFVGSDWAVEWNNPNSFKMELRNTEDNSSYQIETNTDKDELIHQGFQSCQNISSLLDEHSNHSSLLQVNLDIFSLLY